MRIKKYPISVKHRALRINYPKPTLNFIWLMFDYNERCQLSVRLWEMSALILGIAFSLKPSLCSRSHQTFLLPCVLITQPHCQVSALCAYHFGGPILPQYLRGYWMRKDGVEYIRLREIGATGMQTSLLGTISTIWKWMGYHRGSVPPSLFVLKHGRDKPWTVMSRRR